LQFVQKAGVMNQREAFKEMEPMAEPDVMMLYEGDYIQKAGLIFELPIESLHCPDFPRITNLLPLDSPVVQAEEEHPGLNKFIKAQEARHRRLVLDKWRAALALDLTTAREQEDRHEDGNEKVVEAFLLKVDVDCMNDQLKRFEASIVDLQQDGHSSEVRRLQQEAELQRLRRECAIASAESQSARQSLMATQAALADKMDDREKFHQQELDQLRQQLQEREGEHDDDLQVLRREVSARVKTHETAIDELRGEAERLTIEVTAAHVTVCAKLAEGAKADMALDRTSRKANVAQSSAVAPARLMLSQAIDRGIRDHSALRMSPLDPALLIALRVRPTAIRSCVGITWASLPGQCYAALLRCAAPTQTKLAPEQSNAAIRRQFAAPRQCAAARQ